MTLRKFLNGMKELFKEEAAQTVRSMSDGTSSSSSSSSSNSSSSGGGGEGEKVNEDDDSVYDFYGISNKVSYQQRQSSLQSVGKTLSTLASTVKVFNSTPTAPTTTSTTAANEKNSMIGNDNKRKSTWSASGVSLRSDTGSDLQSEMFGY